MGGQADARLAFIGYRDDSCIMSRNSAALPFETGQNWFKINRFSFSEDRHSVNGNLEMLPVFLYRISNFE